MEVGSGRTQWRIAFGQNNKRYSHGYFCLGSSAFYCRRQLPKIAGLFLTRTDKMITVLTLFLLLTPMSPIWSSQKSGCNAPPLSDDRIKEIMAEERTKHAEEMPKPFPRDDTIIEIRREGCNYAYIEKRTLVLDSIQIFKLNKLGVIVNIITSNRKYMMDHENKLFSWCSQENSFSQKELAKIIIKARKKDSGLPSPFPKQRVRVSRSGCLYYFWEYAESPPWNFHVFMIDQSGELIEARHSP